MKKPDPETELHYPTEHDMLLKDESWVLLEIKLLKEELTLQKADLKRILLELAKYRKLKLVFKK